jgi:hypothetical protein
MAADQVVEQRTPNGRRVQFSIMTWGVAFQQRA